MKPPASTFRGKRILTFLKAMMQQCRSMDRWALCGGRGSDGGGRDGFCAVVCSRLAKLLETRCQFSGEVLGILFFGTVLRPCYGFVTV